MKSKTFALELNSSELDTILAALRLWQCDASHIADGDGSLADIASEHGDPLANKQIDALCERINCSPKAPDPIIFTEGGIVQAVILPTPDGESPYVEVNYDLVDYDVFEGESDEYIAEYWANRSRSTREYMRANLPEEYAKFQDCADRAKK